MILNNLREAYKKNLNKESLIIELGILLDQIKQFKEVIESFEEVLKKDKDELTLKEIREILKYIADYYKNEIM